MYFIEICNECLLMVEKYDCVSFFMIILVCIVRCRVRMGWKKGTTSLEKGVDTLRQITHPIA